MAVCILTNKTRRNNAPSGGPSPIYRGKVTGTCVCRADADAGAYCNSGWRHRGGVLLLIAHHVGDDIVVHTAGMTS